MSEEKTLVERVREIGVAVGHLDRQPGYAQEILALCDENEKLQEENARLREALTPSKETEKAFDRSFNHPFGTRDALGQVRYRAAYIPWSSVVEIMAAIRKRAGVE